MTNRPELVFAYYACFHTGAIAAPLNIRLKTAELRPLLARLRPALYLGQAQLYPQISGIEPEILLPDGRYVVGDVGGDASARPWARFLQGAAGAERPAEPDPDRIAMLQTTSGTTGIPKLVAHTLATRAAGAEALAY